MKNIVNVWRSSAAFLLSAFSFLILITSCSKELDETLQPVDNGSLQFVVSDFPTFGEGAATRAIGFENAGKTAWENNDKILVHLYSQEYGNQAVKLTFKNGDWNSDGGTLSYLKDENPTITAVYAPDCEIKSDNTIGLIDGRPYGMAEYILANTTISGNTLGISFDKGRTYSRFRFATMPEATLTVEFTGFTPAGASEATSTPYSLTTDDDGNAYLYGTFAKNGTVTATAKHQIYPTEGITKISPTDYFDDKPSTSGQSYVLGVKLGDITNAADAKTGYVALKDGSFVSEANIGNMTPAQKGAMAGIVFCTKNETDPTGRIYPASLTDDKVMNADFPHCTHGLIVSLTNTEQMAWLGTNVVYESVYDNFQNTDHFNPTNVDKSEYVPINAFHSSAQHYNSILGYNNTKILEAYNAYCSSNSRTQYIVKPIEALSEFAENNPAPFGSTGWYLPSAKELHMLCHEDVDDIYNVNGIKGKESLNIILSNTNIGGDTFTENIYWTSTDNTSNTAIGVKFIDGGVSGPRKHITTYDVRYVCAF